LANKSDNELVPGLAGVPQSAGQQPPELKPAATHEDAAPPANTGGRFLLRAVRPDLDIPGTLKPQSAPDPIALIDTSKGAIKILLFRQLAPITVANFVDLVSKGFYNGLTFHRVVPGFCIQGGCPFGTGIGGYTDPVTHQTRCVPLEVSPQLRHNAPGVVALARSADPNSGSSQFYITLSATPFLDGKYAVFGGVISGMDVVQSITKGDKIKSISMQIDPLISTPALKDAAN
jgi:cyclophilin family peptidyl-prolyl cis-trans isomerase